MDNITIKKIDGRYNGGLVYKYMIEIKSCDLDKIILFNKIRIWCQDTLGHSCELHDAWTITSEVGDSRYRIDDYPVWTWQNDHGDTTRRIYLKTDKEYALAKLRWC